MKKAICLVLFSIVFISCSNDVTFNNVAAFQGVKDNLFWKASDAKAAITASSVLTVEALTLTETLTLKMPVPGTFVSQKDVNTHITYPLGTSVSKKATYDTVLNNINLLYLTGNGIGDGEIVITDYDGTTVSGTYRFNAINSESTSLAEQTLNFQNGIFYKVPIVPSL